MMHQFRALMKHEGLSFGEDMSMVYSTRLAQELAKWADSGPEGSRLHTAIYQAYFVEGKNIGTMDVLLATAKQAGLSVHEARKVLEQRRMREAVDDDWNRSGRMAVTGVPTFIANDERIVGAQPYERLSAFLEDEGASGSGDA